MARRPHSVGHQLYRPINTASAGTV
ncbi:MAG: hypothetical protein QOH07_1272, partial [Mycobacterium sp.]|nr:hypothetical protein [Mycobacterium sp.]